MDVLIATLGLLIGLTLGGILGWFYAKLEYQPRIAAMQASRESLEEKVQWLEHAKETLQKDFGDISIRSLKSTVNHINKQLTPLLQSHANSIDKIRGSLEGRLMAHDQSMNNIANTVTGRVHENVVSHTNSLATNKAEFEKKIKELDTVVKDLETKREGAYQKLSNELSNLQKSNVDLHNVTNRLESAMRSGQVRGKWGEIQLRKIAEMSGMSQFISFDEQVSNESGIPDMVIRLPNGGNVVIDSKFPLEAYMHAVNSTDQLTYEQYMGHYVKSIRTMIKSLSDKKYWESVQPAPELVILFVPIESCLSSVLSHDVDIVDFALQSKVILASPITLVCFLKAIAYGWQQFQISKNAKEILQLASELHNRTANWLDHLRKTGDKLSGAVESYNKTVSSLQTRFFPQLRKFENLAALNEQTEEPNEITQNISIPPIYKQD